MGKTVTVVFMCAAASITTGIFQFFEGFIEDISRQKKIEDGTA